jgi:hypothetical protein
VGACADLQRLVVALRVKRVYEEPEEVDGERMLIDRLWPRGLFKEKAEITVWRKVEDAETLCSDIARRVIPSAVSPARTIL